MNLSSQPSLTTNRSHVFRMIGALPGAVSACKVALCVAGFGNFKSYGHSFICSKQALPTRANIVVHVEFERLGDELCQVSFRKFGEHVTSVQHEMLHKRLSRVQTLLQAKAA